MTRSDSRHVRIIPIAIRHTLRIGFLLSGLLLVLVSTALASTTWYVNGLSGSDNNNCTSPTTACKTISHAISLASSGDSIMVAAATYTENLLIAINLRIIGSSASTTIVDGGGADTVVSISSGVHATLSKLTFQNGNASGRGGGIDNLGNLTITHSTISGNSAGVQCRNFTCFAGGGGIRNAGTMTIVSTTISGNSAGGTCGNILNCVGNGGGIFNASVRLQISRSTISENLAFGESTGSGTGSGAGGGISNSGTLAISDSTIAENSAGGKSLAEGGGIANFAGATTTISSSTISGNSWKSSSGGGGGIFTVGTAILQNSIVAENSGDCDGNMTSNGYNLSGDSSCKFSGTGDLTNTDPQLGPLQSNGGPTQTMALPSGSPAVDAGNPNGCTDGLGHLLKTDQRGKPRPDTEDTGGCDMGAYERQSD